VVFSLHKDPVWREYSGKWKEASAETVTLSFSSILLNRRLILSSPQSSRFGTYNSFLCLCFGGLCLSVYDLRIEFWLELGTNFCTKV
jgi:hypothetical protein